MRRDERMVGFTETIWAWFERHKRTLPWRDLTEPDATQRAYRILVSEVMLQQTQVSRVEIVFKNFLERFPKIEDLARASNGDVILAWRGMGYNSRALRLRDAAKKVVQEYRGVFPKNMEELLSIKGLGLYTAAAIRNFAFNLPTPCIDTNIRRILHRTFIGPENADGTWRVKDGELLGLAEEVLDAALSPTLSPSPTGGGTTVELPSPRGGRVGDRGHDARNWHAALMDFGSLVQTKNNPKWDICPLTRKGLMKATRKNLRLSDDRKKKTEPGREIAGKFVPNRIIRGRVVEELRDASSGLKFEDIGARVCIDWSQDEHREWLRGILEKLKNDALIRSRGARYLLAE
jgi:A/G-specific adenine glycosylase